MTVQYLLQKILSFQQEHTILIKISRGSSAPVLVIYLHCPAKIKKIVLTILRMVIAMIGVYPIIISEFQEKIILMHSYLPDIKKDVRIWSILQNKTILPL